MKKILHFSFLLLFVTIIFQQLLAQNIVNHSRLNGSSEVFVELSKKSDSLNVKEQPDFYTENISNNLPLDFQADVKNQSQNIREEWMKRGGKISYVSIMLSGIYFNMDMGSLGKMNGFGGGYSLYVNKLDLKIPEFKAGQSNWNCLNWGYGIDFVGYGFSNTSSMVGFGNMNTKITIINAMFTGNIGWTFGLGKFINEGNWKGIALTFKYRPSFNLTMTGTSTSIKPKNSLFPDGSSSEVSGKFNAGGFGFDIDFSNYSATMDKLVPKPKSKISFFLLPPIGGNPLMISVSYGLVIFPRTYSYKRIRS